MTAELTVLAKPGLAGMNLKSGKVNPLSKGEIFDEFRKLRNT